MYKYIISLQGTDKQLIKNTYSYTISQYLLFHYLCNTFTFEKLKRKLIAIPGRGIDRREGGNRQRAQFKHLKTEE